MLIDVRPADDAQARPHPGRRVDPGAADRQARSRRLPDRSSRRRSWSTTAAAASRGRRRGQAFVGAGQQNVLVVDGGLIGWQAAGNTIDSGVPAATTVAYAPKPRAGSIAIDEFSKLARSTPADVLILDVRNPDEANGGMIKGAVLIPDEETSARLAEVPKDKRIVTHCLTGIRAEMAYHKLKQTGYKVELRERRHRDRQGRQPEGFAGLKRRRAAVNADPLPQGTNCQWASIQAGPSIGVRVRFPPQG